jgi:hypothetical protein
LAADFEGHERIIGSVKDASGLIDCGASIDVRPTVEEQSGGCHIGVFRSHM